MKQSFIRLAAELDRTAGQARKAMRIALAAQDHGVESAIAINLVVYPDVLRTELGIPRELLVVIGIALGYADAQGPEDSFRSERRPLSEAVRFVGV